MTDRLKVSTTKIHMFAALALLVGGVSTQAAESTVIYAQANYEGQGVAVPSGDYTVDKLPSGMTNDQLKSFKIPNGLNVAVFKDWRYEANVRVLTEDTPDFTEFGISSFRIFQHGIVVDHATYGKNCGGPDGNATEGAIDLCNGKASCELQVTTKVFGDPKVGCGKDFTVNYTCPDGTKKSASLKGEAAHGDPAQLSCEGHQKGIAVSSATYGKNCGAPDGNATEGATGICNGKTDCELKVTTVVFDDPKVGCSKEFAVDYTCPSGESKTATLKGEAAHGDPARLSCG